LDGYRNCYINKKGKLLGKFCAGDDYHNGQAAVEALIDDRGNVIDPADTSHGYQTPLSYEVALRDLLKVKLAKQQSANPIEFEFGCGEDNFLGLTLLKGSGDEGFDTMVLALARSIERPRHGLLNSSWGGPYAFKLVNGELSAEYPGRPRRRQKTVPTLPEGTPIPDSE